MTNATLDNNGASGGYVGLEGLSKGAGAVNAYGSAYGGGMYVSGGTVNMTNATLESNIAKNFNSSDPPSTGAGGVAGGGLYLAAGTTASLDETTVAQVTNNIAVGNAAYDNIDGTYKLS